MATKWSWVIRVGDDENASGDAVMVGVDVGASSCGIVGIASEDLPLAADRVMRSCVGRGVVGEVAGVGDGVKD